MTSPDLGLRRTIALVAILNLGYFGVEFAVARAIGSVSLFADSIDFLEDAAVNALVLVALSWSPGRRLVVSRFLAAILLVPGLSTLLIASEKLLQPAPPDGMLLSLSGSGALAINLFCAYQLARFRAHGGSLTRAAYLSARNDALANIAIILAGAATLSTVSAWPDLVVGLGIFLMNLDAAREVLSAATAEHTNAAA
jgi:Co/Zn/Cd efflux system component